MYNPNQYGMQAGFTPQEMQFAQFDYSAGQQQPQQANYNQQSVYTPQQSQFQPPPNYTGYEQSSNPFFKPVNQEKPINTPGFGPVPGPDDEDYDNEPPLLEELGINFSHIMDKTFAVLNPAKESIQEVLDDTDLAGPLVFCLAFGGTLLLAGKLHFNYIYGLGVLACIGMWALITLMTPNGVSPTCVISILGYCLLPMCLLSTVGVFISLRGLIGIVLTPPIVLWCSLSASKLFVTALSMQQQRFLVGYPCALVYSVFALLTVF